MPNLRWHSVAVFLATAENVERLGKKSLFESSKKGEEREGKCHKFIYLGYYDYVCRAFVVFGILHIVTLKDHSLRSLSFQLEVFVILITNFISFVANF